MANTYADLRAWQHSMKLTFAIYRMTDLFPKHEMFGLTAQMRRAAVSIASNIAEGQARFSDRDFRKFLGNARGSWAELRTQVAIAKELHYAEPSSFAPIESELDVTGKLLNALQRAIQRRIENSCEATPTANN